MATQLQEILEENKANIKQDEADDTASMLGHRAMKYFDLRRNPSTNYYFSYDRMLDAKGSTII